VGGPLASEIRFPVNGQLRKRKRSLREISAELAKRGHFSKSTDITGQNGKLEATSSLPLDDNRVNAHWYLWEGERPAIHSYAKKTGYIGVRYNDELFELSSHK
jgi:hypothetical protein